MAAALLTRRRLLDPREAGPAAERPIAGAVNIPFSELPSRVHELPPHDQELGVVGPAQLVREVIAWLATIGRRAVAAETWAVRDAANRLETGRLWEPNAFLSEERRCVDLFERLAQLSHNRES